MNVVILGYGAQGKSAVQHWLDQGDNVTVADQKTGLELPSNVLAKLGDDYLKNLDKFDQIVRSPSIHPSQIIDNNPESPDILSKVTSNTNEFFRVCPTNNIIGVTGTKGKGTTSTLITKMLEASGRKAHLIGNIGTPPLEVIDQIKESDWVVMELANFQLIDLKYSPHIAVCVMVEPEHLDWHEDLEEYISAKQQLFIHQNQNDVAIYFGDNELSEEVASASEGILIPYFESPGAFVKDDNAIWIDDQKICDTQDIKLIGKHNRQNICAATTAFWQIDKNITAVKSVLTSVGNLPYRLELVREINGIKYYNDSFSTAPGSCKAAINAITTSKILLIGGHDRLLDLNELYEQIKQNNSSIRTVIIYGASKDRVSSGLKDSGFENFQASDSQDLKEIVQLAHSQAKPGDSVIFSPGFPSFDMFKNFQDRGDKFNEAVNEL